jgi:hypothetical protein
MDAADLEQQCFNPYPMCSLEDTPAYEKIFLPIARAHLCHPCVLCFLWSDDFEPNNIKNNRSSVWVLTMTILVSRHVETKEHFAPIIPYDYYKLPYNYYLFLREFCNATKHYQPRRMNVGISSKILHHLVCAAPFRGTYQVV